MSGKPIRTNADLFRFLGRSGAASFKVPEGAPEQVKELFDHVHKSVEEKFEESDIEELCEKSFFKGLNYLAIKIEIEGF